MYANKETAPTLGRYRECWTIYRGSGFLAVLWFGSSPIPPLLSRHKLGRRHTGRLRKRDNLLTGKGGKGVGGAKWHGRKKAWSSMYKYKYKYCILYSYQGSWTGLRVCLKERVHERSFAQSLLPHHHQVQPESLSKHINIISCLNINSWWNNINIISFL